MEQQRRAQEQARRSQEQSRKAQEQRRLVQQQQQRRAAAAKADAQRHRVRQGQYLHEAHGARREKEAKRLTEQVRATVAALESVLATGLDRSPQLDLPALAQEGPQPRRDRITRVSAGLQDRDPVAVESFLRTVLRLVPLPAGFPRRADVAYYPEQEQAVVRLVVPDQEIVPEASEYKFLATADEIRPVPRPASEVAAIYRSAMAQLALLVTRDVLAAEPELAGAAVHGLVDRAEPACLVSLVTDRSAFEAVDLAEADPLDCLSQLGGTLAPLPAQPAAADRAPIME